MELEPIVESKVIIVEGGDDKNLLTALAKHIGLSGIQIISSEGKKHKLSTVIDAVRKTPDFANKVNTLGVAVDADTNACGAFESVQDALKRADLSVPQEPLTIVEGPPRIIIMIWPCDKNQGKLEDVCLQSVTDCVEMTCVNKYFECLGQQNIESPHNMAKAKAQTFLAAKPETYPKVGVAALKGYWPFDNEAFDKIKDFLRKL